MNKHKTAEQLIQYLEGEWKLSRTIEGSHSALANGLAYFKPTNNQHELNYYEDVEILLHKGTKLHGYQHYIYRCENHKINVYFSDGCRLFHSIHMELDLSHRYCASHLCQLDTYVSSYLFMENHFEIEHRVNGPKKNYISCSKFKRII